MTIFLKSESNIVEIKKAATILSDCLSFLSLQVKPGVTGLQIDKLAEEFVRSYGGTLPCNGYKGYPANICISTNQFAVHCIPNNIPFVEGDVVKLDLVVGYNSWNSDSAITVLVPPVKPEVQRLAETTYQAMLKGIEKAIDGNKVSDISKAIYETRNEYSVVKEFCGHGIGFKEIHEDPKISNVPTNDNTLLCAGMTCCIEPIFSLGKPDVHIQAGDWNTWTLDNSIIAHWEHTILIRPDGLPPEILTRRSDELNLL